MRKGNKCKQVIASCGSAPDGLGHLRQEFVHPSGRAQVGGADRQEPEFTGPFKIRTSAMTCGYYRTLSPVTALPMIMRWISDVPSKMVKIFASRCQRSTGNSRVYPLPPRI